MRGELSGVTRVLFERFNDGDPETPMLLEEGGRPGVPLTESKRLYGTRAASGLIFGGTRGERVGRNILWGGREDA